jgi:hypothetical protein
MRGTLISSAGRLRASRRLLVLIYATAVVYFFYAPWSYFLLGVLFFADHRMSKSGGRLTAPEQELLSKRRSRR